MQKLRVTLLAVATLGAAVTFYVSSPAQADVTATTGSAFGAQVTLLGIPLIPPTPTVSGGPAIGYLPPPQTTVGVGLPGSVCPLLPSTRPSNVPLLNILDVCAITVATFGVANANPHLNSANSSADIAGVAVGGGPTGALTLSGVNIACRADGNDAVANMTVADASLGTSPLLSGPVAKNTQVLNVPGTAEVFLNYQPPALQTKVVGSTAGGVTGANGVVAEAAHITLLNNTVIILGHIECLATGFDVNEVTTTSTSSTTTS